jgi:hypothetical protein
MRLHRWPFMSFPHCLSAARQAYCCCELVYQRHDSRANERHQMLYSPRRQAMEAWLCFLRILVQNLVYAATKLDLNRLAKFDRCLNFPGIGVSVQDMMDSLARVGGNDRLALLR